MPSFLNSFFSKCNNNKHWSNKNFLKNLHAANAISNLEYEAKVLEIGAYGSCLVDMVRNNFGRKDIKFVRVDLKRDFTSQNKDIINCDITDKHDKCKFVREYIEGDKKFDMVVMLEVIEHLVDEENYYSIMQDEMRKKADEVLNWISKDLLKSDGELILSTPTPPMNKKYERLVWPDDHYYEMSYKETRDVLNTYFKIVDTFSWSMENREFNEVIKNDKLGREIFARLSPSMPKPFIRAIMPMFVSELYGRQTTFVCEKRREGFVKKW